MGERMFQEWRQFLEPLRWYATHSFITAHKMGSKEADALLKSWSAYPTWYIQEGTPPGNGLTSDTLTCGLTMNQNCWSWLVECHLFPNK